MKLSLEERRLIYCSRNGHSNILQGCFGYISCMRCDSQIGDSLGGSYSNAKAVMVGHGCKDCRANYEKLTKKDKELVPEKILRQIRKENTRRLKSLT